MRIGVRWYFVALSVFLVLSMCQNVRLASKNQQLIECATHDVTILTCVPMLDVLEMPHQKWSSDTSRRHLKTGIKRILAMSLRAKKTYQRLGIVGADDFEAELKRVRRLAEDHISSSSTNTQSSGGQAGR